jgi:hypothetical protein
MATDFTTSYAEIIKYDKNDDGTLTVYGKATSDDLDIDNQICDNDWLGRAMPEWFKSGGNIREQHSSIAAGVATEYEEKKDGYYVTAKVVDEGSIKKVEHKVLKGFSIGIKAPRIVRDTKAANGRIVDGQIVEVSLVDRPANPTCQLVLAKSVGGESTLTQVEELIESDESVTISSNQTPVSETPVEKSAVETPSEAVELSADTDIEKSDCTCDGCAGCKADGGCDKSPCDKCTMAKSATAEKCLECGCHKVDDSHGRSDVSTAEIVAPKSAEGDDAPELVDAELSVETPAEEVSAPESLDDEAVAEIVEKAVKSATESVKAEIAELRAATKAAEAHAVALESELVTAKSAAVSGGPKRTGREAVTTENELLTKATEYRVKAAATSDPILVKGYKALEKEYLSKAGQLTADED